ncbi:MAG: hypothetical protein MJ182_02815 [Treponema sp.]|nr:hypothetical protein [Treponema sp.]
MKKLSILAGVAAAAMLLAGCASSGAKKDGGVKAPEHPMTYVLDLADTGDSITFVDNTQYGESGKSTRQAKPAWSKLLKPNKVKNGDTVRIVGRITSDKDLDSVMVGIADDSSAVNYWLNLYDPDESEQYFTDIKAGVPFDVDMEFPVVANMVQNFILNLGYGEQNDGFATFTFERVCESDIGMTPPEEKPARTEPKEFVVDISRDLAFVEMKPEYPWENGIQNTLADPTHYQATVDVTKIFGEDLPIAGDTLTLTWNTKPSIDIAALKIRFVENTASVPGWWKEIDVTPGEGHVVHENLKAYEKAEIHASLVIGESPIEGISFCITYDLDAGVSGCTLMYAN